MGLHFFTSITANFLPKARVLSASILKFHPQATIHVVLCDSVPPWFALEAEPFHHLLTLADLGLPNLTSWVFQHDLVELCTAVKGFALQTILSRPGCDSVIYLDPDILVLSSFDRLLANFDDASILLTPHQSQPESTYENVRDNELLTIQHGTFNLGFLGVKNSPNGQQFASWWTDRLRDFCFDDLPIGLFVDQRWPDLIPTFFPDHRILRDPGYNVAYWNLTQRRIDGSLDSGLTVDGQPLVFFHFSGIDSGREWTMLQRWASDMPALFDLRSWYQRQCEGNGDTTLSTIPWAYGFFANGDPILKSQRRRYRENPALQARFPDPFRSFPLQFVPDSAADSEEQPVAPYRIFVIATPADEQYVDETLSVLKGTTVAYEQLWLLTQSLTRDVQSISVDATRYEDFASHVLQNFADKDIVLLRAGALPPPQWDLRLAWTAARHLSALTVSPLDARVVDEAGLFASAGPQELDRLCYLYRRDDDVETGYFSHDCVYIRSAAVRALAANRKQLRLSNLVDDAARQRWQHLQTAHLCVPFRCPLHTVPLWASTLSQQNLLRPLQNALRNHSLAKDLYIPRRITSALTCATLHISHSWGGGIEQWISNFAETDLDHEQLILRSVGPTGMSGTQLELYRFGERGRELLQTWTPAPGIRCTAIAHSGYREILNGIITAFSVGRIIVSSLIGHSLDCLGTPLPTVFVCHDYYPFCSAINLTFGETCQSCEAPRLEACLEENPLNQNFPNIAHSEWLALRASFLEELHSGNVKLVAPSRSVQANYTRLLPELAGSFQLIRHGLRQLQLEGSTGRTSASSGRLRVLLLGSLIPHKGVFLLDAMLNDLLSFADLTLAGGLENAARFAGNPKIRVIPQYKQQDLPRLVADVQPDVGLFLSVWPETFSYTVHELQSLGIPPVATNVGGFVDAIEEGVTGFLCQPEPLSLLSRLRHLAAHPADLADVRSHLSRISWPSLPEMVAEYAKLTPDAYVSRRYFTGPHAPPALPEKDLQIYWSTSGSAFSEADSYRSPSTHLDEQTARLYIPASREPIGRLRFDPGSEPGLIQIKRAALCLQTGDILWSIDDPRMLLAGSYANLYLLGTDLFCLTGEDPQIELPVPEQTLGDLSRTGGYLEVRFSWGKLESQLSELLSAPESLQAELSRMRDQLATLQAQLNQQQEKLNGSVHEVEVLRLQSESLARVQQSLVNSFSWRLTKPIRSVAQIGRKLTGGS